jgi:hypothetical protein
MQKLFKAKCLVVLHCEKLSQFLHLAYNKSLLSNHLKYQIKNFGSLGESILPTNGDIFLTDFNSRNACRLADPGLKWFYITRSRVRYLWIWLLSHYFVCRVLGVYIPLPTPFDC